MARSSLRNSFVHFEPVGLLKGTFEQWRRHVEADEIMVRLKLVATVRNEQHIERELHEDMLLRRFVIRHVVAKFFLQFGIDQRQGAVDGDRMSRVIRSVVTERPQRERVLVHVGCVTQQRLDEVSRFHVVQKVGEEVAAERVIAEILDDRSAVGVSPRGKQGIWCRARILLQKQRPDARRPTARRCSTRAPAPSTRRPGAHSAPASGRSLTRSR